MSRLAPCPDKPNCVSTLATADEHRMPALEFDGSVEDAVAAVEAALRGIGGRLVSSENGYRRAEVTTPVFRFVDDVEVEVDAERKRIDFRSASRVGYSDLGVNRRRMRKFSRLLTRDPAIRELS